jgi:threonine/homoserine/homoserine lactone efflux protein
MEIFLQGWVVGFIIASPLGPVGVLCIRRTLTESRLVGLLTVLGAATADAFYGLVAGLGLTAVSHALLVHRTPLRLGAGLFLLAIGVRMLRAQSPDGTRPAAVKTRTLAGAYFSTLLLMLANPFIILSFLAVFAALGLHMAGIGDLAAAWLLAGLFLGSAAWWVIFLLARSWLRGHLERGGLHVINLAAGTLICGFALWQFLDVLRRR